MRLICPNCSAEYDVDESVIPEGGRDVQCSNCGHTWWQNPASESAEAETPEAPESADDSTKEDETATSDEDATPPAESNKEALETENAALEDAAADAATEELEEEEATATPPAGTVRRSLDDAVLDVLRQEAAHEASARQTDDSLEVQPELGIEQSESAEAAAEERPAPVEDTDHGQTEAEDGTIVSSVRTRSSKLPDIDEINSTLDGRDDAPEESDLTGPPLEVRRRGFRMGFMLMMLIVLAVILVYTNSARLAEQFPGMAATINGFTETVDAGRIWLDQAALNATEAIRGLTENDE